MTSAFDGIPYEEGDPLVIVTQRPGMRIGRSRVGTARVGSGAVQQGEALSVSSSVPVEAATDTIGALRLSTYYKGLEGFIYPNVPKGKGRLALYFADFEGSGSAENVMDVSANGNTIATGVDPYDLAGANGEYVLKADDIDIPGGPFEVRLTATAGHTFLNDATLLTANIVPVYPPPAAPGTLKFGCCRSNTAADQTFWTALVEHESLVAGTFQDLVNDPTPLLVPSHAPWLEANPERLLCITMQPINGFDNTPGLIANAQALARHIENYGIAAQTVIRPMQECNAPWFPWGTAAPGNTSGAVYRALYRNFYFAMKAIAPALRFAWNTQPMFDGEWNGGQLSIGGDAADPALFYPGDDACDIVTHSAYMWGLYEATPADRGAKAVSRWTGARAFATLHNKQIAADEWACVGASSSVGGAHGDDPIPFRTVLNYQRDAEFVYSWYFDLTAGNVDTLLEDNPGCVATAIDFCNTLV